MQLKWGQSKCFQPFDVVRMYIWKRQNNCVKHKCIWFFLIITILELSPKNLDPIFFSFFSCNKCFFCMSNILLLHGQYKLWQLPSLSDTISNVSSFVNDAHTIYSASLGWIMGFDVVPLHALLLTFSSRKQPLKNS